MWSWQREHTNLRNKVMVILCLLQPFLCYLNFSVTVFDERLEMFHLLIKFKKEKINEYGKGFWTNALILVKIESTVYNKNCIQSKQIKHCVKNRQVFIKSDFVSLFQIAKDLMTDAKQPMLKVVIFFSKQ